MIPFGPAEGEGWLSARLGQAGFERRILSVRKALDPAGMQDILEKLFAAGGPGWSRSLASGPRIEATWNGFSTAVSFPSVDPAVKELAAFLTRLIGAP